MMAYTKVPTNAGNVPPRTSDQTIRLAEEMEAVQLDNHPTVLVARNDDGSDDLLVDRLQRENYNVLEADSAHVLDVVKTHSRPIHLLLMGESLNDQVPMLKDLRSELQVVFISKPVNADGVLAIVRQLLGSLPSPSSIR